MASRILSALVIACLGMQVVSYVQSGYLQRTVLETVERMKRMASYSASWISGGISYTCSVTQTPEQTAEQAEAAFEAALARMLMAHPRDRA